MTFSTIGNCIKYVYNELKSNNIPSDNLILMLA